MKKLKYNLKPTPGTTHTKKQMNLDIKEQRRNEIKKRIKRRLAKIRKNKKNKINKTSENKNIVKEIKENLIH